MESSCQTCGGFGVKVNAQGHGELKGQNHILAHNFVYDKDRDLQQTSLECPDQVQTCGGNWVKDKGQGHGGLKGQNYILVITLCLVKVRFATNILQCSDLVQTIESICAKVKGQGDLKGQNHIMVIT